MNFPQVYFWALLGTYSVHPLALSWPHLLLSLAQGNAPHLLLAKSFLAFFTAWAQAISFSFTDSMLSLGFIAFRVGASPNPS